MREMASVLAVRNQRRAVITTIVHATAIVAAMQRLSRAALARGRDDDALSSKRATCAAPSPAELAPPTPSSRLPHHARGQRNRWRDGVRWRCRCAYVRKLPNCFQSLVRPIREMAFMRSRHRAIKPHVIGELPSLSDFSFAVLPIVCAPFVHIEVCFTVGKHMLFSVDSGLQAISAAA